VIYYIQECVNTSVCSIHLLDYVHQKVSVL